MDAELLRLLQYLDQDGVTELVLGSGQPLTLRRGGTYTAVSTELVTRAHIGRWLLGSGFEAAMPDGEGFGEPTDVDIQARRYSAQITRRGDDVIVRIEVSKTPAPPVSRTKSRHLKTPPTPTPVVQPPVPLPPPAPVPQPPSPDEVNFNVPSVLDLGTLKPSGTPAPAATPAAAKSAPRLAPPSAAADIPMAEFEMLPDLMPDVPLAVAAMEQPKPTAPPAPATRTPPLVSYTPPEPARVELPRTITKTPPAEGPVARAGTPRPRTSDPEPPVQLPPPAVGRTPTPMPMPMQVPLQQMMPAVARTATGQPAIGRTPTPMPIAMPAQAPVAVAAAPRQASLRDADEKPNTTLIAKVVRAARARGASDLHVAANRPLLARAMGELVALDPAPLPASDVEQLLGPLLGAVSREQLATRGYVDLALEIPDAGRIRGNISRIQGGLKGSFRLAFPKPPTLEELNLPKELAKLVSHHQGLVVFAGPSGHGKTTSLAALVDLVNSTRAHHILTIEDPVEIEHPRKKAVVSQREVGKHTRSFAAALKASLREDPDVIVIGELRDRETVEIALTAAETGHLVMATMSTPSAAKTIDRLIDMFPPDDQQQVRASLGGALRAIVAQRLLPRVDGGAVLPAVELLTGCLPLVSLIRDGKLFQLPNLMQRGRSFGMIRLDDSLAELVRNGLVAEDVALRYADSKRDLQAAFRGPSPAVAATLAAGGSPTATPAGGVAIGGPPSTPGPAAKKGGVGGIFGRKDRE